MNVGELIAKLSQLPPSTRVILDGECGYDESLTVYRFQARVERYKSLTFVHDDNGRDDVETVVLITQFGHDGKEEM